MSSPKQDWRYVGIYAEDKPAELIDGYKVGIDKQGWFIQFGDQSVAAHDVGSVYLTDLYNKERGVSVMEGVLNGRKIRFASWENSLCCWPLYVPGD